VASAPIFFTEGPDGLAFIDYRRGVPRLNAYIPFKLPEEYFGPFKTHSDLEFS